MSIELIEKLIGVEEGGGGGGETRFWINFQPVILPSYLCNIDGSLYVDCQGKFLKSTMA